MASRSKKSSRSRAKGKLKKAKPKSAQKKSQRSKPDKKKKKAAGTKPRPAARKVATKKKQTKKAKPNVRTKAQGSQKRKPAASQIPKRDRTARKTPRRGKPSFQKKIAKSTVKSTKRTVKKSQRKISAQLRAFRRAVGKLVRAGVLPKKTNVKTVKPTKALKAKVKAFKPVIDGKATALKLSKKKWQQHYKEQGHVVRDGFVLLDNIPGHKYAKDDRGIKTIRLEGRYETIELPIGKTEDLEKFLHELEFNKKLEKLKAPDESWAFRFYGNNSRRIFRTLSQLVDYISQYETVEKALKSKDRAVKTDMITAIEIVRVNSRLKTDTWRQQPDKKRDFKPQNKAFKRYVNAKGRNDGRKQKDRHKPNRWQRLKDQRPLEYQDQLRKGRARIKAWRKKRKP